MEGIAEDAVVLHFDDPARTRLVVSASPSLPRLHAAARGEGRSSGARASGSPDAAVLAALNHHLHGAILAAIDKPPAERIVTLRFAGPSGPGSAGLALVAELLGRSSNVHLLDPGGATLASLRILKSRTHAGPGAPRTTTDASAARSRKPRADDLGGSRGRDPSEYGLARLPEEVFRAPRMDPHALTREAVAGLAARSRAEDHPLADLLLTECPALGALAARDIEHRAGLGEDGYDILQSWLTRASQPGPGFVYSEDPGAPGPARDAPEPNPKPGTRESTPSGSRSSIHGPSRSAILSPLPLIGAGNERVRHDYPTLNEAASAYYGALEAVQVFRARRDALLAIVRREAKRASGIVLRVSADLAGMKEAGHHKRQAEALLAGMSRAERRGEAVLVEDPYAADGAKLLVPIDPALSLSANADRYFQKYRKAERGRAVAEERLAAQSERENVMRRIEAMLERLEAPFQNIGGVEGDDRDDPPSRGRIDSLTSARVSRMREPKVGSIGGDPLYAAGEWERSDSLAAVEAELRAHGIAVGLAHRARSRKRQAGAPPPPVAEGVRIYRSSEGYEILVGKGAQENDRLTFKIASPEDFWLHASGSAGAHVVVRNPKHETRLPRATLHEAAELAGFFSKAKAGGRAQVMVTRRKYVRRIRGAPRGTVTVKKHESLSVVPRNPFESTTA